MFQKTVRARTETMRKAGEKHVTRSVTFPNTLTELKQGIGPWKSVKEMFQDAIKHRVVMIQSKMRAELEGNGTVESDDEEQDFVVE